MKNHFTLLLLLFLAMFSCSKKDSCEDPVDCLPPITQTGEGTIGCLINGEPFTPGGHQLAGPTQQAFYQYVDEDYYFGLSASRDGYGYINISINRQMLKSDLKFILGEIKADENNFISNFGEFYAEGGTSRYYTTESVKGEVYILKFSEKKGIVSGTFWFDAVNEEGKVVEIREGRFDMKYN